MMNSVAKIALMLLVLAACVPDPDEARPNLNNPTGKFSLELQHWMQGTDLSAGEPFYLAAGDSMYFSRFQYAVSRVALLKGNGDSILIKPAYSFINPLKGALQTAVFEDIPAGAYTAISFNIGADSAGLANPQAIGNQQVVDSLVAGNTFQTLVMRGERPGKDRVVIMLPQADNSLRVRASFPANTTITVGYNLSPIVHFLVDAGKLESQPNALNFSGGTTSGDTAFENKLRQNVQAMFKFSHVH